MININRQLLYIMKNKNRIIRFNFFYANESGISGSSIRTIIQPVVAAAPMNPANAVKAIAKTFFIFNTSFLSMTKNSLNFYDYYMEHQIFYRLLVI